MKIINHKYCICLDLSWFGYTLPNPARFQNLARNVILPGLVIAVYVPQIMEPPCHNIDFSNILKTYIFDTEVNVILFHVGLYTRNIMSWMVARKNVNVRYTLDSLVFKPLFNVFVLRRVMSRNFPVSFITKNSSFQWVFKNLEISHAQQLTCRHTLSCVWNVCLPFHPRVPSILGHYW